MANEFHNPAFEHCFNGPEENQLTHTITTILDRETSRWTASHEDCKKFCLSMFNTKSNSDINVTATPAMEYFEEETKWDDPPAHTENDPQNEGEAALARIRANMFAKECLNREDPLSMTETMDAYLNSKRAQVALENPSITTEALQNTYLTADEWSEIRKVYAVNYPSFSKDEKLPNLYDDIIRD